MARGKVLRDPAAGAGIISAGGTQHGFTLEGIWKSDVAPKVGMVVNFELNDQGELIYAEAVDEKTLAKEQAELAIAGMKEHGSAALAGVVSRVGKETLIAWTALVVSWFFLTTIYLEFSRYATPGLTFWQLMGIVNAPGSIIEHLQQPSNSEKGFLGILALIGLVGPFLHQFIKNPLIHLTGCLPFLIMVWVAIAVYTGIHDAGNAIIANTTGMLTMAKSKDILQAMANGVVLDTINAIKFSPGFYLAIVASFYLAFKGVMAFFVAKKISSYN